MFPVTPGFTNRLSLDVTLLRHLWRRNAHLKNFENFQRGSPSTCAPSQYEHNTKMRLFSSWLRLETAHARGNSGKNTAQPLALQEAEALEVGRQSELPQVPEQVCGI